MSSVNARGSRARPSVDVDAIEESLEGGVVELDVTNAFLRSRRNAEDTAIQSFVVLTHAGAVEEQDLQGITSPRIEDEERAASRVVPNLLLRDA